MARELTSKAPSEALTTLQIWDMAPTGPPAMGASKGASISCKFLHVNSCLNLAEQHLGPRVSGNSGGKAEFALDHATHHVKLPGCHRLQGLPITPAPSRSMPVAGRL